MRLGQAATDDVVRNSNNGSFYRYARPEKSRARIRPLEHFPNGRLIPKPTDTLVDADLPVAVVGPWSEGMVVEGPPTHARAHYERELRERIDLLDALEAAYALLPVGGTGVNSRGSWANKVKNCRSRIEVLRAGLEDLPEGVEVQRPADEPGPADFARRDMVLLPSGSPGLVLGFRTVARVRHATVRVRAGHGVVEAPVPVDVLRPWAASALCTL